MIWLIFCVVLLLYYLWVQRLHYKLYWQISGSLGLPFIGAALDIRNSERNENDNLKKNTIITIQF